jgi:hypothetical protein
MFIIIAKECKNIRNIVVEHKSLTAQIIPSWSSAWDYFYENKI